MTYINNTTDGDGQYSYHEKFQENTLAIFVKISFESTYI